VRRRPYAVILFDEVEKAHADVFNVLLQVGIFLEGFVVAKGRGWGWGWGFDEMEKAHADVFNVLLQVRFCA
jgi:ATP-dependent Clp protease ATP-binding subunit ClpA